MSDPTNPRSEYPNTYMVQDRASRDELVRLQIQDQMITASMGGSLPEQPNPERFVRVLDVGCGTGAWLIEAAKTYPNMKLLIGVDASKKVVDYARSRAEAEGLSDRVEFCLMDALLLLEFPNDYFDLINQRLGMSYLRMWDWPKLLSEYQRVCRPGGVIRITESNIFTESSSPALLQLSQLFIQAFYRAGHIFAPKHDGLTAELVSLLARHGIQEIETYPYTLHYRAGTPEGQHFFEDMRLIYRAIIPFFRKWAQLPEDYEAIYQRMLNELQQPDFEATWRLLTVWGIAPS